MRDLLRAGVVVSTDEVKADFVRSNRQVNLEYLRFAGTATEPDVVPDRRRDRRLRRQERAPSCKELYEQKRFVYEKVPDERKLRQILVKVPHDATDAQDKAARDKANALADKLKKGAKASGKEGVTFAEVARELVRRRRQQGAAAASSAGARTARPTSPAPPRTRSGTPSRDAIVGPLRGTDGFVITKVEGQREGNVPFDQAKLELAEEKLREERADAQAKAAADEAVAKLQATPGKTMKDLFPPPTATRTRRPPRRPTPRPGPAPRRPACSRCAPRAKGRSSRGSASRTRSPRRPSR